MAEAALFSLATDILKSLATEFAKPGGSKILLLSGAKGELQSLEGTVQSIRPVLLDAEKKQWDDEGVKVWLGRLKVVLCDVQDLLDDVATEDLRRKVTPGKEISKAVRVFFSKSNQLTHRVKVTHKIQELRKTLVEIESDSKFLNLERHPDETLAIGRGKKPERPSPDEKIIGREEDKRQIKQFLLKSSSNKSVSFVAIVGIGGVGKTALARLVYNDGEVREHFELKMWVCVSDFDVNSIIKDILNKAEIDCQGHDDVDLPSLLRETLSRKKYLLVLDDLWNEDRYKWSTLGDWLEGGLRGSKILVTTRNHTVAMVTNAKSDIYCLPGLSDDESWNLFKKIAFEDGEESLDSEQDKIGRSLVKKCAGVPLAVRTIGGLFCSKNKDEWPHYEGGELLEIMKVLRFSYDHLRSCLKHCFAYCSLFPKDFVYDKRMMIHLWVAQGFIESDRGKDNLEEVADIYLTELLCRSFLDVASKGDDGEVLTFKMHDLMHDLAQEVAGGECKIIDFEGGDYDGGDYDGGIRHVSFFSEILSGEKMMSLLKTSKLRTFLYSESADLTWPKSLSSVSEPSVLDRHKVFSELRHCRVLVLGGKDIPLPPSSFGKLKHLRLLHISANQSIQSLPDSITDLVNLQFLKLSRCEKLETFPRDLRYLIYLRYLCIEECGSLSYLPPLSDLHSLKTLILWHLDALEFVQQTSDVGQSMTARHFFPSLERLSLLYCRNLKGWWGSRQVMGEYQKHHRSDNSQSSFPKLRDVEIRHCPHLNFVPPFPRVEYLNIDSTKMLEIMPDPNCPSEAAAGSTFTPFSKLKRLYLSGRDVESPMLETLLQSANNLEFMSLSNCNIRSFSRGMRHLSSLQELHVDACEGLDLLCEEDQHDTQWPFLMNLRVLKILSSQDFGQLPEQIQHVTALQSLEIYHCPQLRSLPEWIGNFSLLEKLVLSNCESLERLPFEMCNLACLKELRILKCPTLKKKDGPQIAHIPVIVWEDELDKSDY